MIQSLRDEGFESPPYPLHNGDQEIRKYEGSQNYLAGVGDGDDELSGNVFQSLFLTFSSSP